MKRVSWIPACLAVALLASPTPGLWQESVNLPGWGEPIDPDGDCEFTVADGALTITVPGTSHILRPFPYKRNAARVLRSIEGNWAATVKIRGDFEPRTPAESGQEATQSAGLMLWLDDVNFVRLARTTAVSSEGGEPKHGLVLEYFKDGQLQPVSGGEAITIEPGMTWIRMTRHIDKIKAEVSADGESWTEASVVTVRLSSRMRLGPVVTNTSKEPVTVTFEQFQVKGVPLYP